ncbi:MAG: hypothetical protein JXB32_00800, partial [Deltaproteobacteria bacterium]|nr:hypothetical protein [Deltaproteobacteria bacterium]
MTFNGFRVLCGTIVISALVSWLPGCGDDSSGCEPGAVDHCICPDGSIGHRVCTGAGSWGACDCGG